MEQTRALPVGNAGHLSSFFQKVFRPVGANRSAQIKDRQPEQSKPLNLMPLARRVTLAFLKMPPSQTKDQIIRALLLHQGQTQKRCPKPVAGSARSGTHILD